MTRAMNPALALLAVLAVSACSSGDDASSTDPATGGSDTGFPGMGTAGDASGSGRSDTGTSSGPADASGTGTLGTGASGTGDSGTSASGTADSGAANPSAGTGGARDSGADGMTGSADAAPPTPGACVGDWKAGTYPPDFITAGDALFGSTSLPAIGGYDYAVHVPKNYDCRVPTPILYGLHGLGMSGYSFNVAGTSTPMRKGGLVAKADEAGFILVMPTGMAPTADAVTAVREIFKNLESHLNIDHKRVYATGHSFGGSLSFLIACTAADLFTAVAPNAWTTPPTSCRPANPISVLASAGDQDAIAPGGGNLAPAIRVFVAANECSTMAMPAAVPASGPDTECVTNPGCKGGVEVTACTVKGGGHVWFGDETCGTGAGACAIVGANSDYYVNTDFAWDFLKRFSR
jgi:polyhydroxybutyrate depolymerase